VIGALVIVMGIVGSAIVGLFVDWSHRYKLSLIVSLIGGTGEVFDSAAKFPIADLE
jgi:hypothetical protein